MNTPKTKEEWEAWHNKLVTACRDIVRVEDDKEYKEKLIKEIKEEAGNSVSFQDFLIEPLSECCDALIDSNFNIAYTALYDLKQACLASDFNEHWDAYLQAEAVLDYFKTDNT